MQVFKAFFKVLNKNKSTLIIYVVIYLGMTIIISNSLQETGEKDFSKVSLNIGIENQDQGEMGAALMDYLERHNSLKEVPDEKEALQDAMYYQEVQYVLVIPQDFSEKFAAGEREGLLEGTVVPGSSSAYLIENEIEYFLKTISMYLEAGYEKEQALALAAEDLELEPEVNFLEESNKKQLPGGFYFFQYIPYVFLIMMILGLGGVMKTFKNKDLAARNKCSAMSFLKQNVQMILGCMVYTIAVYLIFMVMACIYTDDYMFTLQGALSALNAFVFSICALSVAYFSIQFVRNVAELNIMSNIFGLAFSFLGGVFVSLDVMSEGAEQVAKFVPSYWYVIANREIQSVTGWSDAGQVYQAFLVVLVFAAAFFTAGLLVNRMKVRGR